MSRIEQLTPEQIARFPEFVKRWTEIGLCTAPADRPRAEAAIIESYKYAGLKPPKQIVWCGSPLSQGLTRAIILDKNIRASVRDSVWDSVRASVRDSVGDSVWAYTGSFFILPRDAWKYTENIKTEGYPFQCLVTLWEQGLVTSFDGKKWRLHGGKDAKILWEGEL